MSTSPPVLWFLGWLGWAPQLKISKVTITVPSPARPRNVNIVSSCSWLSAQPSPVTKMITSTSPAQTTNVNIASGRSWFLGQLRSYNFNKISPIQYCQHRLRSETIARIIALTVMMTKPIRTNCSTTIRNMHDDAGGNHAMLTKFMFGISGVALIAERLANN